MFLVKIMFQQRKKGVKITDSRVRLTTEVLQGIRLIKFYAWEAFYTNQIGDLKKILETKDSEALAAAKAKREAEVDVEELKARLGRANERLELLSKNKAPSSQTDEALRVSHASLYFLRYLKLTLTSRSRFAMFASTTLRTP